MLNMGRWLMSRTDSSVRWRQLITKQAESGLSGAAFCRERKVCRKSFYAWRRKLQAGTDTPAEADKGFAEVVRRANDGVGSGVSILPGPPRTIRVERGFDAATLQAVLSVVDAAMPA